MERNWFKEKSASEVKPDPLDIVLTELEEFEDNNTMVIEMRESTYHSKQLLNRLRNLGCYVAGPIDFADDLGVGWREDITAFLQPRGVNVFNPLEHPFHGIKTFDDVKRPYLKHLAETRQFDELRNQIKAVNKWDLRAIDLSSFIIVNYNMDIHMCGTHEELFMALGQNKPVLLIVKDKTKMPKWLYGRVPHEHMFEGMQALKDYLKDIDENPDFNFCEADEKRWLFLEGPWMYPTEEEYVEAKAEIDKAREESQSHNPYLVENIAQKASG